MPRPSRSSSRPLRTALVLLGVAACGGGDPASPSDQQPVTGRYTLAIYAGAALPARVLAYEIARLARGEPAVFQCEQRLEAETLELSGDGRFARAQTLRSACTDGTDTTQVLTAAGLYSVDGSTVTLTFAPVQGAAAPAVLSASAVRVGDGLAIRRQELRAGTETFTNSSELVYRRAAP